MSDNLIKRLLAESHLDQLVTRVVIGPLAILVATDQSVGLSSCFREPNSDEANLSFEVQTQGRTLNDLVAGFQAKSLLHRSLAMAALNAALPPPKQSLTAMYGQNCLLEKTGNGHLVVVGNFPFLSSLEPHVGRLTVIQEDPHLGYRGVETARKVFPEADVIVLTASAFVNGTMDALLQLAESSFNMVLGATAPMHHHLFSVGVDAICGAFVEDVDKVAHGIEKGISFKYLKGIRRVAWFRDLLPDRDS